MGNKTARKSIEDLFHEETKKKLTSRQIHISRVSPDIKNIFVALAQKHFNGDYGATLSYLILLEDRNASTQLLHTQVQQIGMLLNEIILGSGKKQEEKSKGNITLMNGVKIKRG